jgi:hypothetical protein
MNIGSPGLKLYLYFFVISQFLNLSELLYSHSIDAFASATRELAYHLLERMAKGVGADPALLRGVSKGRPRA